MSQTAHIPSHRKPRERSRKNLALRAGVAGGVLGTIAVTAGAAPASSTGKDSKPTETTAQLPTLTADLPVAAERTADSLAMSALQYELEDARDAAASKAAETAKEQKAEAQRKAEEARKAEAAEKAKEREAAAARASRASSTPERTTLSTKEAPSTASTPAASTPAPSTGSGNSAALISFLRAQVGKAYVSGATGPSAYDCSGLTQAAFKTIGIDLPRVSQAQSTTGTQISVSEAQPGDLLFWGGVGSAYHVAVYVGNGQYIDAANPSKGVALQNLSDYPPTSATRVL